MYARPWSRASDAQTRVVTSVNDLSASSAGVGTAAVVVVGAGPGVAAEDDEAGDAGTDRSGPGPHAVIVRTMTTAEAPSSDRAWRRRRTEADDPRGTPEV